MNGGSSIAELRAEARETEAPMAADVSFATMPDDVPGYMPPSPLRLAVPALLIVVPIAWMAVMTWFAAERLATLDAVGVAGFVAALLIVPLFAAVVWLLTQRNSHAEARRFGGTARALRDEAAMLERTVAVLGAALHANRDTLAEQVRDLTRLGDVATTRLATIGRGLSEEIDQADVHARALGEATDAATARLQVLLAAMPRAQAETDAAAARLDSAAGAASDHVAALDVRLTALAERGREAETVAGGAAQRLAAQITRIDQSGEAAGIRLDGVTAQIATTVDALLDRTSGAVDRAREGITTQSDALMALVEANQAALDSAARETADALAERVHIVELVIDRIAARLEAQRGVGGTLVGELEGGFGRVNAQLDRLDTQGVARTQALAASIGALGGSADAMTEALRAGDAMATRTIATTDTLLVALDAATREIDETLPDALGRLDQRIAGTRSTIGATKPELLGLVTAAESTHDAIEAIADVVGEQRRTVEQLSGTLLETLSTGRVKADALGQMVDEAIEQANRFADDAAPRLLEALLRVRETATVAAERARETLADVIPQAAAAMEAAGTDALRRASTASVTREIAALTGAADDAVAAVARAGERLDAQLRAIDAAAAAVETRIEAAQAERETAANDSFARRASLLIEALNSASIDLTRSFSPEVADSAWAAYLKGDRGVFTRRAVRLLDSAEQRDIARMYDDDAGFREQVNRYIHDFEAMLRTILATRDGSPLGVTLLSSDMGKLYVAMAQAIERLR